MQQNEQGRVVKIAGPLVLAEGLRRANLFDVVRVSEQGLIGEIIEIQGTGEQTPFTRDRLNRLIDLGEVGIKRLIALQNEVTAFRDEEE